MKRMLMIISFILVIAGCSDGKKEDIVEEKTNKPMSNQPEQVEKVEEEAMTQEVVTDPIETVKPIYEMNSKTWSVEPMGDANERVVLLTIDDAPDKYALEMAKTLDKLDVKAIFFVNGHFLDTEEEAAKLKEIHRLGFPIGNHTYTHGNLSELTEEEILKEMVSLNDRVEEIIGERPKFFRAPYGVNTDFSRKIAMEEKMQIMNWTYGYDWEKEYQSKEALAEIMVQTPFLKNGANLLMHDRAWTNDALEDIVKGLKEKGFEIVNPDLINIAE